MMEGLVLYQALEAIILLEKGLTDGTALSLSLFLPHDSYFQEASSLSAQPAQLLEDVSEAGEAVQRIYFDLIIESCVLHTTLLQMI